MSISFKYVKLAESHPEYNPAVIKVAGFGRTYFDNYEGNLDYEVVEDSLPEVYEMYVPKSAYDRLKEIFNQFPDGVQAAFYSSGVAVAVESAMKAGKPGVAKLLIEATDVSEMPQAIQDAKAQMLSLFP